MLRILITDDHSIVRKGIRQILQEGFPDACIDEADNAESMIRALLDSAYDVTITDLSMPGRSALDVLPQIREMRPHMPVLIISIHPEDHYAVRVLKAGAMGYLSKDLAPDELVSAVRQVLKGKKYITPAVAEKLANIVSGKEGPNLYQNLSDREFSVLTQLASGRSLTDIADSMHLSINTISTYRARILSKLNLKNNSEITRYCLENNLT